MKNLKRLMSGALAMIIAMTPFSAFTSFVYAENETEESEVVKEVLYENSFNTGSNADLPEVENTDFYYPGYNDAFKTAVNNYEYASENAPKNYRVSMRDLSAAENNGNMGVRFPKTIGVGNGPVILFDFRYQDAEKTPSRTPEGLRSGKYTLSYDFSLQGDEYNADGDVRVLANCFHGNTASNLVHFDNTNWSILAGGNSWTYPADKSIRNMALDADAVYNYEMVLDLDNHKIQHYIDGEFKGEITGYKKTIKFLLIVLNGDFDYFDNVKLTKEITYPLEYSITSGNSGNNFYGEEAMNFTITATNREDTDLVENLVIKATNPQGGEEVVLLEKELAIANNSSESFEFSPNLQGYGSWILSLESQSARTVTTRVARIVEVEELNPEVAVCFHMDGRHGACDIHEGFELMEKAGISAARTDYGISVQTEETTNAAGETIKVPVGYSGPSGTWYENVVAESKEHGIDVLPILYIAKHGCYGTDADGGYNTTDEALSVVYEAAKKFAESTKGQFKWFELGNEDNYYWKPATQNSETISLSNKSAILNRGYIYETPGLHNTKYPAENYTITVEDSLVTVVKNSTGEVIYDKVLAYEPESGADYAKMLKAGYDGIKAGNPDAMVMNSGSSVVYVDDGATIRNQYEFATELLGAIEADPENKYFDIFAVHSYHAGSAPEEGDRWKRYMDFMEQQNVLTELLEGYGQASINPETGEVEKDVERWATEIGYSSSWEEERHYAAWMTRLMALNFMGDEYGPYHDKYFIYALFNHGFDKAATDENTYGIVNNWADEYWYKKSAYAVKEPYLAVAQWNKMMNGLKYNEEGSYINHTSENKYDSAGDEILTAGLFNLEFSNEKDRVNVVWDASGNNEVTTVAADEIKKITVYDMYGNIEKVTHAASVDITATEEPVYVEFTEPEVEVLLYRDYEDYKSGATIYNNGTKYGTWPVGTGGSISTTSKAITGINGTAVEVNTATNGQNWGAWGNKVDFANLVESGIFYMAFDIEKKSDEVLTAQDGETPICHENLFYFIDSKDFQSYVRFSTSHSSITSGLGKWSGHDLVSRYLGEGNIKIEVITDLDNNMFYYYENGVKILEAPYTKDINRLCFNISDGIKSFDNFTIVHYPGGIKDTTFSMTGGEFNTEDKSFSVFFKSDTTDKNEDVTYSAPYGISLASYDASAFKVKDKDGNEVKNIEVTKGERTGEYKISVSEALKDNTSYTIEANGLSDILGAKLNTDANSANIDVPEFFNVSGVRITKDTESNEVDWVSLASASKVYAEVTYKNEGVSDKTFTLVGSLYSNGRLVKVITKDISAKAGTYESVKEYMEIPLEKISGLTVKAMAVEGFDNMKPLCEAIEKSESPETVLYYNAFPTGTDADLPEAEHELYYFYGRNANLKNALNVTREYVHDATTCTAVTKNYTVALDAALKAEFNGEMGIKMKPSASFGAGPVVLLDFRYSDSDKTPTQNGALIDGVYKLGFDFVLDSNVTLTDGIRLTLNCMHGNCGNSFAWFMNDTWHNLKGSNTWTYTEKDIPITNDELHHYEIIFDLDNDIAITYLDGVRYKDTTYKNRIYFLNLVMGGKVKYLDNVEFTKIEK